MHFGIQYDPKKHEIWKFNPLTIKISIHNNQDDPYTIKELKHCVPHGFHLLRTSPSQYVKAYNIEENTLPIDEELPPKKWKKLTLELLAMEETTQVHTPVLTIKNEKKEKASIGSHKIEIQPRNFTHEENPPLSIEIESVNVEPGEGGALEITITNQFKGRIKPIILHDLLPENESVNFSTENLPKDIYSIDSMLVIDHLLESENSYSFSIPFTTGQQQELTLPLNPPRVEMYPPRGKGIKGELSFGTEKPKIQIGKSIGEKVKEFITG